MVKKHWIKMLLLILFVIIIIILCWYCYVNFSKGGEGAYTMFDVNSNKTLLKTEDGEKVLTDEERTSLLQILKNNIKETSITNVEKNTFNITIDFCNGNVGYLSTENLVFMIEDSWYSVDEEDCKYIMGLLQD